MSTVRSAKHRKKISFAIGTAPPRVVRIAISISRHETVEQVGVTTYFIDILHSGRVTVVKRRYKDFEILNKTLIVEVGHMGFQLPPLPQKRWFQTQRWLNRYDAAYIDDRRYGLEVYLRSLLRLPGLIDNCPSLRNFLNLTMLASEDAYALERDAFDAIKHEYTYVYEPEPDEGEDWPVINRNRPICNGNIGNNMNTGMMSSGATGATTIAAAGVVVSSNNRVGGGAMAAASLSAPSSSGSSSEQQHTNAGASSSASSASTTAGTSAPSNINTGTNAGGGGRDDSDSDQDFDSDDDKDFSSAANNNTSSSSSSGSGRTRDESNKSPTTSKFSSVFIDGKERSGSFSSTHSSTALAGSFPGGVGGASSSTDLMGSHLNNTNAHVHGGSFDDNHADDPEDSSALPEDPNDVWAMSISSAAAAGAGVVSSSSSSSRAPSEATATATTGSLPAAPSSTTTDPVISPSPPDIP